MTQRGANYPRRKRDDYQTPPEVTRALLQFLHKELSIRLCDPCPGRGAMVKVFEKVGYRVTTLPQDFLTCTIDPAEEFDIVVNPPYGNRRMDKAVAFIERAIEMVRPWRGKAVVLLPFDFDCARGRRHLFIRREFAGKIVLPARIAWFNKQSGSLEHAWFVFDHRHKGKPWIRYMPLEKGN